MENKLFTTKKLALTAMTSALAFAVSFLEIPIFPQIGLKLDFSFCIMLLGGYMLGAIYAEIIVVAVSLLCALKSMTLGIGELANFMLANVFVVLPVLVYKYKRGLKNVIVTLILVSVLDIGVALLCNRYIFYPLYEQFLGVTAEQAFQSSWYLIVIFNALKCTLNSIITVLLYKRLKNTLHFFIG